ncbi:hypothetical protein BOX15_Mlig030591g2 [Macrostomum lignano]|uniref:Uncharacterized protein n=1 Tax=Macrostomum lignano TaxID=282301 RepID=A0A267EAH3_9PLAT|nr:hypothetical protein BOX15_Mlig030591g2 [Macrostomum lignano]
MSIYFDQHIKVSKGNIVSIAWHEKLKYLAVASYDSNIGGSILFFKDEGERVTDSEVSKPCAPTCIAWHPVKPILVCGWESGEASVWNEREKQLFEFAPIHKTEIRELAFNGKGIRLLTGDNYGTVYQWKLDMKGKPQPAPNYSAKVSGAVVSMLLQPISGTEDGLDLSTLAKLAVSGDERALDLFTSHNAGGSSRPGAHPAGVGPAAPTGPIEANCFFVGTLNGSVHYLDEHGRCELLFSTEGAVKRLLYHQKRNLLISVTDSGSLSQHSIGPNGAARELTKFKLACRSPKPDIIWAGKTLLAMAVGETMVRFWDIASEDNYTLSMQDGMGYDSNVQVTSIAYSAKKQVLAAGTQTGQLAFWKYQPIHSSAQHEPEDEWQLQPPLFVRSNVSQLTWGTSDQLLGLNAVSDVYIITEQPASCHYGNGLSAVQTGPKSLYLANFNESIFAELQMESRLKQVRTTGAHLVCSDGRSVTSYELLPPPGNSAEPITVSSLLKQVGEFQCDATQLDIYDQNVYTCETKKIQVRTLQGTVKQQLAFSDNHGEPVCFTINSHNLVVGSSRGVIRLFDLSRREAKAHGGEKFISEHVPRHATIQSVAVNSSGTCVSVVCVLDDLSVDPRVYVWDVEMDTVTYFNLRTGRSEHDENDRNIDRDKEAQARDLSGRYPISHHWDALDSRLLIVEAKLTAHEEVLEQFNITNNDKAERMVISVFYSSDHGLWVQDSFAMHQSYSGLLRVDTPYFYFTVRPDMVAKTDQLDKSHSATLSSHKQYVAKRTMRDFVGLEESDKNSKEAMLDFSFYLTIGNIDEAFKAMKLIKSESVWHNMARMCVKTRRLDVTSVCLGKMGHARGAMMIRQAQKVSDGNPDVVLAMLASQLGMRDEAERLLKSAQRYDLLTNFYRAEGQWEKAIDVAEKFDRMSLRTTHHEFAKHLESVGHYTQAVQEYLLADTHRTEVPRMLCDRPHELEAFVRRMQDPQLNKWFALFLESSGDFNGAMQFYEAAKDYHSMVKLRCHMGEEEAAVELCNMTGDSAACCYLARHFESIGDAERAVHYFSRAQAFSSALRLCKAQGLLDQLVNLAMLARPDDMLDAARYLELNHPDLADKAILLYQKSGHASHAVDLAFRSKQFGALEHISRQLDHKTDPALLQKCAEFFLENNQFDRAVTLLGAGRQFQLAVRLCTEQNVPMSEELAESLTPEKGEIGEPERLRILEDIAELCFQQRNYHMACKKFTQLGNRLKAMKCLLKSGDTEKIIFFANVSKQKEIYVMAANYLQTLNWQQNPEIMKSIVQFYSRGKALDSLANFYQSCAQLEIEEFQDYSKALGALAEALKTLSKGVEQGTANEDALEELKVKTILVKKFADIQASYKTSRDEALRATQQFIQEFPSNPGFVRLGDAYAAMINHLANTGREKSAYSIVEEMKSRLGPKVNLATFVHPRTLERVHKAAGVPYAPPNRLGAPPGGGGGGGFDDDDDEIAESIDEQ